MTPRANRRAHAGRTPAASDGWSEGLNPSYGRVVICRGQVASRNDVGEHRRSYGWQVGKLSLQPTNLPEDQRCKLITLTHLPPHRIYSRVICPSGGLLTGLSSFISDFPKNISVPIYPKSILELSPSHPTRGAYRDRHETRGGMRWTRQRFARDGIAGRVERLVSDQQRADERCCCVRRSRVVLTPRRWRQVRGCYVGPTGLRHNVSPWTTVAKEPGHRGEREGNR
jgi:hypothetical protein